MRYSHPDSELPQQPIGYWAWAAQKAVVTHIRGELTEFGVTQPQCWVLAQCAGSENGRTQQELHAVLHGYLDVGAALQPEIDALLDRKLLETDERAATGEDQQLRLSPEGDALFRRCAERQQAIRRRIHHGIRDEDYVTTLKVLQRMIHNVGGQAWHH